MTGTIGLVVTDLDGTLWERPETIPERTLDAIAELERRSIPLLIATGRRVASTRDPLAAVGLAPPAVVLNGGLGVDLASGQRFHRGGFSPVDAAGVLAAFLEWDVEPCVYLDDDMRPVRVGASPSTHTDHLAGFGRDVGVGQLERIVSDEHVLAFAVLGIGGEQAHGVGRALEGIATPHVSPDRQYGGHTVTVAPTGLSKWDGVEAFCADRGIDPGAVLAIGDGPNDTELLEGAVVAVVPEDAHDAARAIADHIVGRAAGGGWAELLDLL
ncbi:MAG: HAD family hydrolase [Acidimicrobiia bacterium]|nr:HAD family hydrolase [Acidimicrobiia bacterium]